jgi:hypothetical protein
MDNVGESENDHCRAKFVSDLEPIQELVESDESVVIH